MTHTTRATQVSQVTQGAGQYSLAELRAAAAALTAGAFAPTALRTGYGGGPEHPSPGVDVAVTPAAAEVRPPQPPAARVVGPERNTLLIRVLAGHAGAGASTVTLALADAAAESRQVRVLDAACPTWSTLAAASSTELGTVGGWRRGRRGDRMLIERLADSVPTPDHVPVPHESVSADLTVLDVGWSVREIAAHPGGWLDTMSAVEVLVTRCAPAAFAQVEATLESRPASTSLLVIIGAKRWTGQEFRSAGPRLRELRDSAVFMPLVGARAAAIGPEPLPRPVMSAAQRLLAQLLDPTGPTRKEIRR